MTVIFVYYLIAGLIFVLGYPQSVKYILKENNLTIKKAMDANAAMFVISLSWIVILFVVIIVCLSVGLGKLYDRLDRLGTTVILYRKKESKP